MATITDADRQRLLKLFEGIQNEDVSALVEWAFAREQAVGGGGGGAVDSVDGQTGTVDLSSSYQPKDADLTAIAALDSTTAGALSTDGAGWIRKTYAQLKTALALVKADVGLGNVDNTSDATKNAATATLTNKTITSPLGIVKADVGLGSVDNTADTAKPVSTAQQTALNLKANIASPTFTGTVTIPTGASITAPTGLVKGDVGLGNVDNTSDANKPVSTAQATADALRQLGLIVTAVKTTTYVAAAQDLVPCDTATTGSFTVTLPTAPADRTLVCIKHVIQGGANVVTIACGGSDVINKAGGVTSATLPNVAESYLFQYKASGAIWYILAHDAPRTAQYLASLGGAPLASPSLTGTPTAPTAAAGDSSTTVATTAFVERDALATKVGSITAIGHSYIAGTNFGNTGTDYMEEVGMLAVLCGLLDVSNENLTHHGIAGSLLSSPTSNFAATLGGWAGVLQLVNPNNATHMTSNSAVFPAVPRSNPGLGLIVQGVNDLAANFLEWNLTAANGRNAWKHAMRTVISRLRAGALWCSKSPAGTISWDSIFTFTGTWADVAGINNTGPAVKKTSTNGDTWKVTLPADLLPGTYAICFRAQQNALTTASAMLVGATTMTVADASKFPQSGTFVANIAAEGANTREEVLVTAGAGTTTWTITRGRNGTSASAHGAGAAVTVATDTGLVTWSTNGSNATITGTTNLSGQGYYGQQVPVVKRFVLTAADAGKTITATVSGIVASDTSFQVQFDSMWFESPDPTPVVVMNIPRYAWGTTISLADMATMNSDTASVVAEFDGAVVIADVDTYIWNRGATANGATGTTSPIAVTANDNTTFATLMNASPFKPFRMTINGIEDIWVTAISSSGGSNYSLTCTRGYNGTTPTNQAGGTWLSWGEFIANDNVHPNAYGHPWFAQQIYNAIQTLTLSSTQLARAAGNWTQNAKLPNLDPADTNYIYPNCNALPTAVALAVQRVTWVPVFIPKECTITEIGCAVTAFNAASTIALGIYDSDTSGQRPGAKLYDCGTISGNTPNGLKTITGLACRHRGGIVWLAFLQTGTAATVRCVPEEGLGTPFLPQTTLAATYSQTIGYSLAGQATLPTTASGLGEVSGTASTTNTVAMVHIKIRNTQFQ